MDLLIETYRRLLGSPESLHSLSDFLITLAELLLLGVVLSWPIALGMKFAGKREQLGSATRIQLTVAWTAVILAALFAVDILILFFLQDVPNWTALSPHATVVVIAAMWALIEVHTLRTEVSAMRRIVETAKKQVA